jgi:hypothetical protein
MKIKVRLRFMLRLFNAATVLWSLHSYAGSTVVNLSGTSSGFVTSCAATTISWTVSGATCSASIATTNNGSTSSVSDSSAPTTGSAQFLCTNGVFGSPISPSCSSF